MLEHSPEQDRRDANAWATEWNIKRRNRSVLLAVGAVLVIAAFIWLSNLISIHATRTTFGSEEEMRAALQGRFETDYCEDIEIVEDNITLTYYEISHYDQDYAEKYGYSEYDDSVYDDVVKEWDYRHGVIKCKWMSDITVDSSGNLKYYSQTFVKTDDPKPVPFDPSVLTNKEETEGSDREGSPELEEAEEEAFEASKDGLEETEDDKVLGEAAEEQAIEEEAEQQAEGEAGAEAEEQSGE